MENRTVNVRKRDKSKLGEMKLDEFYAYLETQKAPRSNAETEYLFNGMVRGDKNRDYLK